MPNCISFRIFLLGVLRNPFLFIMGPRVLAMNGYGSIAATPFEHHPDVMILTKFMF